MGTTTPIAPLVEFGSRVRTVRQRLGVSQETLADLAGVHRTYIGTVERGERNPALMSIVKIALALGVDPGELVKGIHL